MFDKSTKINAFASKVWLSSPTMHGDELKYVTEAYETNWMSTVGKNIDEAERVVADKACKWSSQSRENAPWYQHEELGYNCRMSNVIAGAVRGQLPYL